MAVDLSRQGLQAITQTCGQLRQALRSVGLFHPSRAADFDANSDNMALVKAVICSALYPGVATVTAAKRKHDPGVGLD